MVSETLPQAPAEPEVQQPEVTDSAPAVAAEAPPPSVVEDSEDFTSFLTEAGLADAATSDTQTPVGDAPWTPPQSKEEEDQRLNHRIGERDSATRTEQQKRGEAQAFERTAQDIQGWLEQNQVDPAVGRGVMARFLNYNGLAPRIISDRVNAARWQAEFEAIKKALPDFSTDPANSPDEFVSRVVDTARKGYVSERALASREKTVAVEAVRKRDTWLLDAEHPERLQAFISRAQGPKGTNGSSAAASSNLSLQQIDAMPTNDWLSIPKERREQLLTGARTRR